VKRIIRLTMLFIFFLAIFPVVRADEEIVSSDVVYGEKLKLSIVLYKDVGEIDPDWDYYAVKVTLEDIYAKDDFYNGILYAKVWIKFPSYADEVPSNHLPKAGWYWSQERLSFSYQGIGFSIYAPAYGVSYDLYDSGGYRVAYWYMYGESCLIGFWYVFEDYTSLAVGVRIPQGESISVQTTAWASWYRFWVFFFTYDSQESVGTAVVEDNPEKLDSLAGDLDRDGDVDSYDFYLFAGAYGSREGDDNFDMRADLDMDGKVDSYDFYLFAGNYGTNVEL